jgi:phage regulator Rha-like protein
MEISKIEGLIHIVRGQKVILDADLAELYGVEVRQLKRQVRRNSERFPDDFLFVLTTEELEILRCQIGTLGWGRYSKYLPFAFTEQGVAMLSSVLRSSRAIQVNIAIMRVFVQLRHVLAADAGLPVRMKNAETAIADHDRELTEHAAHLNQAFAEIRRLSKP